MLNSCNHIIIDAPEGHSHPKGEELHDTKPDRCKGIEFDAITPDEEGNTFFFKGLLWSFIFYYSSQCIRNVLTWPCQVELKLIWLIFLLFHFSYPGDHLWKGFVGSAERSSSIFKELDDYHHLGHVDAAFRMHHQDDASVHDHIYFFLVLFMSYI